MRTAESVVLTDCPPGPDERLTSIRRSRSSSISISTSSASGMTTTVTVEVWIRPDRLRGRDALDAMDAALELEPAVGAVAVDLDDRLLDPADARLVEAQHLGLEAVPLGVAEVHPQELGREQRGLLAAGAGPDLHDHVAVVVGVARQQQHLELLEQARLVGLQPVDLLAGHVSQLVVGLGVAHLARAGQLRARGLQAPEGRDDGLQPGELPAEPPQGVGVGW